MTDIEFLVSDKALPRRTCLYSWDTGVLKVDLQQRVLSRIRNPVQVSAEEFLCGVSTQSLFGDRHFFVSATQDLEVQMILEGVQRLGEDRVFVSAHTPLAEKIEKGGSFAQTISEVQKGKQAFDSLFKFTVKKAQVPEDVISSMPLLKQNMEELYTKCPSILDFLQKSEFTIFSCLENGVWNSSVFRNLLPHIQPPQYFKLHENIYFLLAHPSMSAKSTLFSYLETEYDGDSRAVVGALFRAVFDLIAINSRFCADGKNQEFKTKFLAKFAHIPVENLLKTLLRISNREFELNTEDFLLTLDLMLQDIYESVSA